MKVLMQRVRHARVDVADECVGEIGTGLLLFIGFEKTDTTDSIQKLFDRVLSYRVFADDEGKMNLSLRDTGGGALLVSQFTLAADTRKGLRPSFSSAAPPALAESLYEHLLGYAHSQHEDVASGRFAADMQISLLNDGPVTFLLED